MLGYNCTSVITPLSYGGDYYNKHLAYYFRHTFKVSLANDEINDTGLLKLWADDGAVVYLNGDEILRVRIPAGPVNYLTPASSVVASRGSWESYNVSLAGIQQGTNVLSVEMHQANITSSDLCFWCELQASPSELHANFKISSGNEPVILSNPDSIMIDQAPAWSVINDASIGRPADTPTADWVIFPLPTPGAPNSDTGYTGILDPPQFSTNSGFYSTPISLSISHSEPDVQIYYTTDGSTPTNRTTASCFLYTGSLNLTNRCNSTNVISMIRTTPPEMDTHTQYGWMQPAGNLIKANVIRTAAFKENYCTPQAASGSWFIGTELLNHSLPVISVISDNANLFSNPTGLFVPGDIYLNLGWNGHYVGLPNANYFQRGDEWERPVVMQMFDQDRNPVFTQLLGIRNHGGWSRGAAQKTMRVYARSEYGKSALNYQLFPNQSDDRFKRFLIRNSGNDWSSTGLRDMVMQCIFQSSVVTDTQDGYPAVIYVNGEYWGVQNIREHYTEHYFERKYQIEPDNIDQLKAMVSTESMEIVAGDEQNYIEVLNYTKTNNLADAEHYTWVEEHMDLDNLIDHYACEIYCCNTDWPGNNLGLWRERTSYNPLAENGRDGRWRWVMYDTDHGFGLSSSETTDMMNQARRSSRGVCQPQFDNLLANIDFQNRFVNRFADLINTAFKPDRVNSIIDQAALLVESEIPRHIERWGRMQTQARWQSNITRMKTFASNRPAPALANIVNEFTLEGTYQLTLDITNGAGEVTCNTITINPQTPGISDTANPYPWTGSYFKTTPISLKATANPGFSFSHWKTESGNQLDNPLVITPTDDINITAEFETGVTPRIAINEFMADPTTAGNNQHPVTGEVNDWFELFNETTDSVDLNGWWLIDDNSENISQIPEGVTLLPGEILQVWADSSLVADINPDGSFNVSFGLGRKGDTITLLTPDQSTIMDSVTYTETQAEDVSTAKWINGLDGSWSACSLPTPGLPNCNPVIHKGILPLHPIQNILPDQLFQISLAAKQSVSNAACSVVAGENGAAVDANGEFSWTPPSTLTSGIYSFRIFLMGIIDESAVTDETTLLLYLYNNELFQIDLSATPVQGGSVFGGGIYQKNETFNITAQAAPLWRFVKWSDGATSATRLITALRDTTYTASFAYGLQKPSGTYATFVDGKPLIYWNSEDAAASYIIKRASNSAGPFTQIGTTEGSFFIDQNPVAGITSWYTVTGKAFGTYSHASDTLLPYTSATLRELTGTVIGTLGSYGNNASRTRDKAFDKDITTFYDAASDGGWPGLDLGTASYRHLHSIQYCPRESLPARMVNGQFQLSLESDTVETFIAPITVHQVTVQPEINVYVTVPIETDYEFQYFRYLPPAGGWGNIAEAEIYGYDAVPSTPLGLTLSNSMDTILLNWDAVTHANGYLISRSDIDNPEYEIIGYTTTNIFEESGLPPEHQYSYTVASVNGCSYSLAGTPAQITTAPIHAMSFTVAAQGSAVSCINGVVQMTLSSELDPRLELVCSESLTTPVALWNVVTAPAFSAPDSGSGKVTITISTNAPCLFFSVRMRN
jgi:hypothetical protein